MEAQDSNDVSLDRVRGIEEKKIIFLKVDHSYIRLREEV